MEKNAIFQIEDLSKDFMIRQPFLDRISRREKKTLSAVHGVSLDVYKSEALSIVGESGCGKSTFARVLMMIYPDYEGRIIFDGTDLKERDRAWINGEYRRRVQMVFQDPYSCLDPRKTVGKTLREVLDVHKMYGASERESVIDDLLGKCGIAPELKNKYPAELSGGQCQRIGIARALLLSPDVLIADEPVSALDVSVQAQVINLLQDLRKELDLTLIFISHDLSVVRYISDRVAVMYLGEIVEAGETEEIFTETGHPYTALLLGSAPKIDLSGEEEEAGGDMYAKVTGELPNAIDVPPGCRFHTRCPYARDICRTEAPEIRPLSQTHTVRCHFAGETDV